jgi:hypothetical protein
MLFTYLNRTINYKKNRTFRKYSDIFFIIILVNYKNIKKYTKAVKKLVN